MNNTMRAVLAAAAVFTTGCAQEVEGFGTEEQASTDSHLAGNAQTDNSDLAVVEILFTKAGEEGEFICTGTLIARNVVLTAGHCTLGSAAGRVIVGTTAEDAIDESEIAKFIPHPAYDPNTAANDIGIVVLADPILTTRPLAVNDTPLEELVPAERMATTVIKQVGYGVTERSAQGASGAGIKRIGYTFMTELAGREFAVSTNGNAAGATACGGDSGGPAFLRTTRGWLLIGTESRGDLECKEGTVKVRTDAVIDWIDATIADNEE
jgi:secreted trypsin-like serine protease